MLVYPFQPLHRVFAEYGPIRAEGYLTPRMSGVHMFPDMAKR
jgi:hypothetical protein